MHAYLWDNFVALEFLGQKIGTLLTLMTLPKSFMLGTERELLYRKISLLLLTASPQMLAVSSSQKILLIPNTEAVSTRITNCKATLARSTSDIWQDR